MRSERLETLATFLAGTSSFVIDLGLDGCNFCNFQETVGVALDDPSSACLYLQLRGWRSGRLVLPGWKHHHELELVFEQALSLEQIVSVAGSGTATGLQTRCIVAARRSLTNMNLLVIPICV